MTVKQLIEALSEYPDDIEVAVSEGISKVVAEGEIVLDPYPDYNLLSGVMALMRYI